MRFCISILLLLAGCAPVKPETKLVKSTEYVAIDRVEFVCDSTALDSLKRENHLLRVEIDKLKKINALLKVKKEIQQLKTKTK